MGFKSLFQAFRVSYKPGVKPGFIIPSAPKDFPVYNVNDNADPLCDRFGVQWVRDAGDPVQFTDISNPSSANNVGQLDKQKWDLAVAADHIFIGQSGSGKPSAIFKIAASFGDPTIPWATSPYYLQIHTPNNGVAVPGGRVPQFVIPAPRPNEGLGQAFIDFGTKTPFNCVTGLGGGAAVVFSVTPNVYTSPGGVLGQINVNWAFYAYQI